MIQKAIIKKILENEFNIHTHKIVVPQQGADNDVYFIESETKNYVLKVGIEAINDYHILSFLDDKGYEKSPKVINYKKIGEKHFVLMSMLEGKLWEDTLNPEIFVDKVLNELVQIKKYTNHLPGFLDQEGKSWKDFLKKRYSGNENLFNWRKLEDKFPNRNLKQGLDYIIKEIDNIPEPYSFNLLHMDMNDRNVLVFKNNISGIIDWTDSIFGDSLLDYARFRLFLTHYYPNQLDIYFKILNLSQTEKDIEEFYFFCITMDYLIWYSEGDSIEQLEFQFKLFENNLKRYNI